MFVPVVSDIVQPAVEEPVRVISFPELPFIVKEVTVWSVPSVNCILCAAVPSSLKSVKVFEPEIRIYLVVGLPKFPRLNQMLLYVFPPPAKIRL